MKDCLTSTEWYNDSQLLLHLDLHLSLEMPSPGAGITLEKARSILREIKPRIVQFHSKGHPGYAAYPTRVGSPHPHLQKDLLDLWCQAARAENVRFFIYYSAGIDNLAGQTHPEWAKRRSDGSIWDFGAHFVEMCFNTDYVSKLFYPMLAEMIERYHPDGFWMDAEIGSIVHCWCDKCVEVFKKESDMDPPRSAKDPGVAEWADFGRKMFRKHIKRTADFIHHLDPQCMYSSSSAFSEVMPEPVIEGVDYLTGDLNPLEAMSTSDSRARTYRKLNTPFDIMLFTNGYAWGERPMQPKPVVQLFQESISGMVHGAKVWMWVLPSPDASVPEIEVKQVGEVSRFLYERKSLLTGTICESEAYVLNSRSFAYQRQDGFQYDGLLAVNKWADEVRGAHALLLEGHYQFDIVHEDHLRQEIPESIRLILIPDQGYLPLDIVTTLEQFATRGGVVVASGGTFVKGEQAGHLQSLFGVCFDEMIKEPAGLDSSSGTIPVPTEWWKMEVDPQSGSRETSILNFYRTTGRAGSAAVIRKVGQGHLLAIAGNVFRIYHQERHPMHRNWFHQILGQIFPNPMAKVENCPGISCVVAQRDNQKIIHLIDRTSTNSAEPNFWYVDQPGHTAETRISIRSERDPKSVTCALSGKNVAWKRQGDYLEMRIPGIYVHEAVVIQY
ncbi:MAG: alpha-amylase family protein [Phycisphaerae bacterium]